MMNDAAVRKATACIDGCRMVIDMMTMEHFAAAPRRNRNARLMEYEDNATSAVSLTKKNWQPRCRYVHAIYGAVTD
jgi:hypothetical protein